jgi:hypothetical protein
VKHPQSPAYQAAVALALASVLLWLSSCGVVLVRGALASPVSAWLCVVALCTFTLLARWIER